jgi:hypothetical protein
MDKEVLHKEIDLIQGVITRMANNSFLLKGWLISLVAVILALSKDTIVATDLTYFNFTICLPVIVFWYLDAFFLHKERCYRKLYEWVIENRKNTDDYLYSLNYSRFEKQVDSIWLIMFSKTLLPFYGLTLGAVVSIIIFNA